MNNQRNTQGHATTLADKDAALNDYFDVLLKEVTETDEAPKQASLLADSAPEPVKTEAKFQIEEASAEDNEVASAEPVIENNVSTSLDEEKPVEAAHNDSAGSNKVETSTPHETVEVNSQASQEELDPDYFEEDYHVEGAPEWAQAPFQALEFTVAKLKLVVPLVHLCGILDWERAELTPMPGHTNRFLGVWPNHGTNSKIVDVAEMVVPDRYHAKIVPWRERVTKVVLIDESAWGIACDEIIGVVTLDPREVRWRTDRTQRAWLAGTLIEHMSALIDANEFAATLLNGEGKAAIAASCA